MHWSERTQAQQAEVSLDYAKQMQLYADALYKELAAIDNSLPDARFAIATAWRAFLWRVALAEKNVGYSV